MTMKFRGNIWMVHRLLQPMSMQRLHMFTHNVAPAAGCMGPTDWIFLVLWTGFCCELFTHDSWICWGVDVIISIFVFFVVWTIHVHCMVTFMSQKRPQRLITKRIGNRTLNSRDQKIVSCLDTKKFWTLGGYCWRLHLSIFAACK